MVTIKQEQAFKEITENHRSVSSAMRMVGYDDDTASKPSNLTKSKGWKELMDKYLPDSLLVEKHNALLNKVNKEGEMDIQAVVKGLDMGYRLKGSYLDKEEKGDTNIQINIIQWKD